MSLGFLWIVFDQKRQGWHDKIAGTYVVEAESEYNPGDPVRYYHTDPDRGWVWLVVWVVIAIGMPGLLLVSLWPLGASVNRAITNFLSNFV